MNKNILMFFAPKFKELGCDVAKDYLVKCGGGKVHGICTGPSSVKRTVSDLLRDVGGSFWHIESEELKWLSQTTTDDELAIIDSELGVGALGRIISADRRVGSGFVRGGLCRPDLLANKIATSPEAMPQQYIAGLYQFLDECLKKTKPDIVFIYAVAGAPALMLAEMAKARNIPFCRPAPARIGNRMLIDDDPRGRLSSVARLFKSLNNTEIIEKEKQAKNLLEEFRSCPEPPEYMVRNHAILNSNLPVKVTISAIITTIKACLKIPRGQRDVQIVVSRVWWGVLNSWRRNYVLRSFSRVELNKKFIYYPLHVDPEASTQVLSPYHTDQLSVIEALAKSAPADMMVVVKEHAPMVGKRPKGFYSKIRRMPRVVLLGPEYVGLDLVQKASITAVLTGTAAWEAIRLGKSTVVIGDSPFLAIGSGAIYEPNLANFPEALNRALELTPASDEELIRYISALLVESFEMDSSIMWGDYLKHDDAQRQKAVSDIADGILRREVEQRYTHNMALRRWVWNSPPELGQNMTSPTAVGMTWTALRF
ncbi:hypothetical protein SAMN04487958_1172 [Vreelandella subterranea]|uniref:Capsule polysaccharide biosynthesis protein n=1 Tax=Vreelandella subterranea TaxID=416874 RepID=A0A1H9WL76_9GAMM|nr:hypothetical protein [Halomonas subterranea]SES34648.1 hypothetical protein SAMN04487958_1172 [Halomonas subterranea]